MDFGLDIDPGPAGDPHQRALHALALPTFGPPPDGPFVVAFEGPNGAGKSTLCRSVARDLGVTEHLGTDPAWFEEPFKTRMIRDADWFASAMFFLSGCFEQMRLLRQRGEPLVVMDRSLWSTLAVHAGESRERLETLLAVLRPLAGQIHVPNLTIVIEASFSTCQARIAHKTGTALALDQLTANTGFHARERAFYRWLGGQLPGTLFLNVDQVPPERVAAEARAAVLQNAPPGVVQALARPR